MREEYMNWDKLDTLFNYNNKIDKFAFLLY